MRRSIRPRSHRLAVAAAAAAARQNLMRCNVTCSIARIKFMHKEDPI